jgi:predicted transcriptional regulator
MSSFKERFGFVKSSKHRINIVIFLMKNKYKTPTEISQDLNIYPSQVSRTLSELSENSIVICINPDSSKGRVYTLTKKGVKLFRYLHNSYDLENEL